MSLFPNSGAARAARLTTLVALLGSLAACSSLQKVVGDEKVDYRTTVTRGQGLEVPPDLTQLTRDARAPQPGGVVSASTFQQPALPSRSANAGAVTPVASADLRVERQGDERWLVTSMAPEALWPQLQSFWRERGLALIVDDPRSGVMETDWAENRAKLPQDVIRRTLGRVLDSLYSTGEKDKFRTRVERTANGSEVFISHRGMEEVYTNTTTRDSTVWQPRPTDPQLEGELLQRLMVHLGAKEETAKTAVAAAQSAPARARLLPNQSTPSLQVDDGFDRAWRRVGLALDRGGFTVEDRDRAQGVYFVRYVDPAQAGKEQPGFLSRMFGRKNEVVGPVRYRVSVKSQGETSIVQILNSQGSPATGDVSQRIVARLVEDLK